MTGAEGLGLNPRERDKCYLLLEVKNGTYMYPKHERGSVERRLKPRLEEAHKAGFWIGSSCLSRMVVYTPAKWCVSLVY